MFVHDTIKINYTREGYLPYYPYHMISDEEMFDGFISYEYSEESISSYSTSGNDIICVLKYMPTECVMYLEVTQEGVEIDSSTYSFSQLKNTLTFHDSSLIDKTKPINIKYTYLSDECYMSNNYPYIDDTFYVYYRALLVSMRYHIDIYLEMENDGIDADTVYYTDGYENITQRDYNRLSVEDRIDWEIGYRIPNWVYSYMLGAVTGPQSDDADIHDLFTLINSDNPPAEFTVDICNEIYKISTEWLSKVEVEDSEHRPPTYFGEPHVWKKLRLQQENPI